jgi:hypothetical protein
MHDDHQAETRRWLIDRYRETNDEIYLRLARQLRKSSEDLDAADILLAEDTEPAPRPAEDDFNACIEMAFLILEEGLTRWAAAQRTAKRVAKENSDGTDEHSLAKRYDRKFKEREDVYFGYAHVHIRHLLHKNSQKKP